MLRQTSGRLTAVAIAALAFSASASAQVFVQPVPNTPAYVVPLPAETTVGYKHTGHLATATRGFVMQSTGQYYCTNCQTGAKCNNGAGSLVSDIGFAFGPTASFFAPCGPRSRLPPGRCPARSRRRTLRSGGREVARGACAR